jgi:hypothetical protein
LCIFILLFIHSYFIIYIFLFYYLYIFVLLFIYFYFIIYIFLFCYIFYTSLAVPLQSVQKYLLLMRSFCCCCCCCCYVAFSITNKVSDEVSSGYYFPSGGLSIKDPYSWEVSMRSCSNNNVSFTSHFTSKTGFCPTSSCFESNMSGADELLQTQSLSAALIQLCTGLSIKTGNTNVVIDLFYS